MTLPSGQLWIAVLRLSPGLGVAQISVRTGSPSPPRGRFSWVSARMPGFQSVIRQGSMSGDARVTFNVAETVPESPSVRAT